MRRILLALFLCALCGAAVFRGVLLEAAARVLIEDQPAARADAIIVLAGSAIPDRVLEAAMLYRDGYAPRILLSREPESAAYAPVLRSLGVTLPGQDDRNRSVAQQLGVPPEAIIEVGGSAGSTFAEAREILGYVRAHGYRTVLLVTSKLHTRRAVMIYRRLAGDRVRVISRPSRYDRFRPEAWWHDRASTRRVVVEYEKFLVYLVIDRWRATPLAD